MSEFSENNVVMLNDEPEIKYVDNFLTPEECKHFIDVGSVNMTDSLVTDIKNGYKSQGRTSKNSWINHNHDDIVYNVAKRIANFVNIPLENAEAFQCVYYEKR